MKHKSYVFAWLVVLIVSLTLLFPLDFVRAQGTLDKILKTGKIKIGVIEGTSSMKDPVTSAYKGYAPDSARWIFEQIKVTPEFVDSQWSTFAAALQSGQIDFAMLGLFATIPRGSAVAFTIPINYLGTGIATLKSSKIRTMADIKKPGIRISLGQGTAQHRWALENFPDAKYVISTAITEVRLMDVITGKADIALGDSSQTLLFAQAHPEVLDLFADNPIDLTPICWAVKKGDQDFLNFINSAIKLLHSTGTFKRLLIKNAVAPYTVFMEKVTIVPFTGKE